MGIDLMRAVTLARRIYRTVQQRRRADGGRRQGPDPRGTAPAPRRRGAGTQSQRGTGAQTDQHRVSRYPGDFTGRTRVEYAPVPGPQAGPGEVVWTWVPFEELDGRGKDRPVLIVGHDDGHLLGLMLTSKDRNNDHVSDPDYVDIGSGAWDSKGRPSEAKLDRIVRVDPRDVRREGGVLDRSRFDAVAQALADRRGWSR